MKETTLPVRLFRLARLLFLLAEGALTVTVVLPVAGREARDRLIARWSRRLLRILHVELRAAGLPAPGEPAGSLIAANHISWLDIVVINAVRPSRFVAKAEVRDWPLIGWMTQKTGNVFIARRKRGACLPVIRTMRSLLRQGEGVVFFPETTTTDGTEIKPFHTELFEAARQTQAHIWPAAIRYANPDGTRSEAPAFVGETSLVESLGILLRAPALQAHLAFAAPIPTASRTRREMGQAAQEAIAGLLRLPSPRVRRRRPASRIQQLPLPDGIPFQLPVSKVGCA